MSQLVTGTGGGGHNGGGPSAVGDAAGSVNIDNWSLFGRSSSDRPTPFLVGPIVGVVTESAAR